MNLDISQNKMKQMFFPKIWKVFTQPFVFTVQFLALTFIAL